MEFRAILTNTVQNFDLLRDATRSGNARVLLSLLGPAVRGFLLQPGKKSPSTPIPARHSATFNWEYLRDRPELARLYTAAKREQWYPASAIDWSITVDPQDDKRPLILEELLPLGEIPGYRSLPRCQQQRQVHALLAWMLSQFLHGEQGALLAACQVTEAAPWMDGKLYGSTQVLDEGRHLEVFHRYLTEKLGRIYQINDNLYVIIDALMRDSRWDIKFLGMQIMIEGLALGAFMTIRSQTKEPLLRDILKYVIADEARHVHFGVLALGDYYTKKLPEKEIREREDWAFEMAVLMRNRFLASEFYEEYYAHAMTRAQWNKVVLESELMKFFRLTMFHKIIPNLKRIGLISDRIRPHYEALGLLRWENEKAAPELTAQDLIDESDRSGD